MKLGNSGQALIQAIVAVAILGIVMAGFSTMMSSQSRQTQTLNQKLAQIDLLRVLSSTMSDVNVCTYILVNPPPLPFDPQNIPTKPALAFPVTKVPVSGSATAATLFVADGKTHASPMTDALVIKSMEFTDIVCGATPCLATTNLFTANFQIDFDGTKLNMPLAPLKFPVSFITTGPAGAQKVSACVGVGSTTAGPVTPSTFGGPGLGPGCVNFKVPDYNSLVVEVWGGGGAGADVSQDGGMSFFGSVIATGGICPVWPWGGGGPAPSGGIATGGDVNIPGGAGHYNVIDPIGGTGGDSPDGSIPGGKGGVRSFFSGQGGYPGGGGGGGHNAKQIWTGGGAGAYAKKTFKSGDLVVGSSIPVCVGVGGRGTQGQGSMGGSGGWSGGNGEVLVNWN
ncbi:MAG: hypothetical protein ACXVA9_04205 [Bdellovibrionales bacterium]